jgi:acyl carrier protein
VTPEEVLAKLSEIVRDVLQLDDVKLEMKTTANEVEGWDSVSTIEIMVAVEDVFDIHIKTGEMAAMDNVGFLVDRIIAG